MGTDRWSSGRFPPCVSVVLEQPGIGTEWKSWLTFELALRGVMLDTNEDIIQDEMPIGGFRFLELDETAAMLQHSNAEVSALDCPWVGRIRGSLGWIRADVNDEFLKAFLPTLARRCRGPFIQTDRKIQYDPLRQMKFSLKDLTSKYGFNDGEAFLSRDEPGYLDYVRQEAESALVRAGIKASVGTTETHHNPLRIWGPILRSDGWEEVREWELDKYSMTIWAYDDSCLERVSYW